MAGNLRDIKEIEAEIEAAGLRGITKQQILDTLRSQAKVGGTLSVKDGDTPLTIAGGWNRIDVWTRSIDTQGIKDGLTDETDAGGWYRVSNAAAGDYTCSASVRFTVDTDGDYDFRIAIVDDQGAVSTTPYQDSASVLAGGVGHVAIAGAVLKNVGRNERLQLEVRGPNGSQVTITYAQFGVQR
jgi:hypothetical protein